MLRKLPVYDDSVQREGSVIARNPYVIGVPLTDAAAFYGRQEFFHFIRDILHAEQQNVIVLYGQRRIGKTSVLHRAAQWLRDEGAFFPVYFDLQGKAGLSLGDVLANLAHTIARRLSLDRPDAALFDQDGRYFSDRFLPLAFSRLRGTRLVLLFDEFDVLGDELASPGAASETLFPYLQDLIASQRQVGFVFVVGRRIEELATHFQAIFKQAVYRRVGHLKPEDSRALIVEPARGAVSYADDAILKIQKLAAGHPYFTQLICFEAFNAVKAKGSEVVTAQVVEGVVNGAIESGHGALNWFWEGLPRAERFILSAVAHVSSESGISSNDDVRRLLEENRILMSGLELKDAPDRLVEWEMLRRHGPDGYAFVVELVRRWVTQEHPLSNARRDIDYVSKRAVRLFENAREAHSAGDLPYARDEYRRTLKANPNHSGAQLGLALVLYELGELDDAIVEFEKAYAIDAMSARDGLNRARLARAEALEKQELADQALVEYEHVLRLAPAEETAVRRAGAIWLSRGEAALSGGDLGAARDAFRHALQHDSGRDPSVRIQASLSAHADESALQGQLEHAADTYHLLLELLPQREEVTTKLAVLQKKVEERLAVSQVFAQALADHRTGRMDQARDGWKKLIQMDVLSHDGLNIATLLAETILAPGANAQQRVDGDAKRLVDVLAPPAVAEPAVAEPADAEDAGQKARPKHRARSAAVTPPPAAIVEVAPVDDADPVDATTPSGDRLPPASAFRRAVIGVAILSPLIVFLLWPASITGIYLTSYREMKSGETSEMHPLLQYSSEWRRKTSGYISDYSYSWDSSNSSVVTVSGGTVKAVGPGRAVITASYRNIRGSTQIVVVPSLVALAFADHKPVKAGETLQLQPIEVSSSGQRTQGDGTQSQYAWTSKNPAVATVSGGTLTAISPGTATITAQYQGVEGTTSLTVYPWDVPPMKANFVRVKFFEGAKHVELNDRKYASEFSATTTPGVWAELEMAFDPRAKGRGLEANLSAALVRSDNSRADLVPFSLKVQRDWPGVVVPISFGRVPPDTYRVDFSHGGVGIGSAKFVVK